MMENRLGLGLVRQPRVVLFGPGQRRQLPEAVAGLGKHALLVADSRMAHTAEFVAMRDGIAGEGVRVSVYDGALPDLPRANVTEAVAAFADKAVEVVVGIGGGSSMDLAKAIAAVLSNGGDVRDYFGEFKVPRPALPIVTVPTTGGTGAEVTSLAIVWDEERGMKMAVADPAITPHTAVIDPELTLTCPAQLSAATAADALSHLVEGFTARPKNPTPQELATQIYTGKNRITDIFAAEGLRLMNRALPRLAAEPGNIEVRADVMLAAYCAGMVINTTGTAGAHAIQSPMAAVGHSPHGFGVGALLPYVMRWNLPHARDEFAEIGRILGCDGSDDVALGRAGILRIEELLAAVGAPLDIGTLGVTQEHFDRIANAAVTAARLVRNNPAPMDRASVHAVLVRAASADRTWWERP
jgi:alcohol dehydrogenase class IV